MDPTHDPTIAPDAPTEASPPEPASQGNDPAAAPEPGSVEAAPPTAPMNDVAAGRARPAGNSLLTVPAPPVPPADLPPDRVELYVRAGMHHDRSPGHLLVICHPLRMYKVPRNLLPAIERSGWTVQVVETQRERVKSVEGIRDGFLAAARTGRPMDVMVISGDGSLDHHVLVGAFWAFYPDLVKYLPGTIDTRAVDADDLAAIPRGYRTAFLEPLPDGTGLEPTEATVTEVWLLRAKLEGLLRRGAPVEDVERKARRDRSDPLLRLSVLATLAPHRVVLRPDGFDLTGLAEAPQERTYQGLYPFLRSMIFYPAGTAADNAVFSGVPGWGYAQFAGILTRFGWLDGLRRTLEARVTQRFMEFFRRNSVVVPERMSVVGFDNEWRCISSHAAGGPAAGRFFTADLTSKTSGLLGYLKRIPQVVIQEGFFGSTVVRVVSRTADGRLKSFTESQLAEGLYTNRAFIAGVGSVPTTGPTSFGGQSSLLVVPPLWCRGRQGERLVNPRSLLTFTEAIVKGILGRALHFMNLRTGNLAGGGRFAFLQPENQVAIKEGESIDIRYMTLDRKPKAVCIQVSGDPFQAWAMKIRSSFAPIPVLGQGRSLALAAARSTLSNLRLQQTYDMRAEYIGGVHFFWHHLGEEWNEAFKKRTGLFQPPRYLPFPLLLVQRRLMGLWKEEGGGDFVDTSEAGLVLGRRGRYAHNNDQTAHLVVLKETYGNLLVRQIRAAPDEGRVYECRARYRAAGATYLVYESETLAWHGSGPPSLIQEDHWFRDADAFRQAAPSYFPVVGATPQEPALLANHPEDRDATWADGQ